LIFRRKVQLISWIGMHQIHTGFEVLVLTLVLVLKYWFWFQFWCWDIGFDFSFDIGILILVLRYCKKIGLDKIYPQNGPINYFIVGTFKCTSDTTLHKEFFSLSLAYKKYNSTKMKQIFLRKWVSYNYWHKPIFFIHI